MHGCSAARSTLLIGGMSPAWMDSCTSFPCGCISHGRPPPIHEALPLSFAACIFRSRYKLEAFVNCSAVCRFFKMWSPCSADCMAQGGLSIAPKHFGASLACELITPSMHRGELSCPAT